MGASKRTILDIANGFNTRVNLYIIRKLYYRMDKADRFMTSGIGKRKASVDIKEEILITRQRLDRIFCGYNFEMSSSESKTIAGLFNISTDYFKENGNLVSIHGITKEDWECFFSRQYGAESVTNIGKTKSEIDAGMKKVYGALEEVLKKDRIEQLYDTNTALYRIRYYFKHGVAYREVGAFSKFLESLELIKISDWKELEKDPADMRKYLPLLKKHYEYASAYLKCRELEKTD